jgi:hypothetical protein
MPTVPLIPSLPCLSSSPMSSLITLPLSFLRKIHLSKLPTNNTQREQLGVGVGKEASWVGLNLSSLERLSSVLAVHHETGDERASQASNSDALLVIADWVGECEAWCATSASCGLGWGLVAAYNVEECDVLKDCVS